MMSERQYYSKRSARSKLFSFPGFTSLAKLRVCHGTTIIDKLLKQPRHGCVWIPSFHLLRITFSEQSTVFLWFVELTKGDGNDVGSTFVPDCELGDVKFFLYSYSLFFLQMVLYLAAFVATMPNVFEGMLKIRIG